MGSTVPLSLPGRPTAAAAAASNQALHKVAFLDAHCHGEMYAGNRFCLVHCVCLKKTMEKGRRNENKQAKPCVVQGKAHGTITMSYKDFLINKSCRAMLICTGKFCVDVGKKKNLRVFL
jgi:hypothetical protein